MPDTLNINDVVTELTEYGDCLWDLYQSLVNKIPADAEKARSMYDTLENVYLEPMRRKIYQMDTQKLEDAANRLKSVTTQINKTVKSISDAVKQMQNLDQAAKIFDGVISLASKVLAALG